MKEVKRIKRKGFDIVFVEFETASGYTGYAIAAVYQYKGKERTIFGSEVSVLPRVDFATRKLECYEISYSASSPDTYAIKLPMVECINEGMELLKKIEEEKNVY